MTKNKKALRRGLEIEQTQISAIINNAEFRVYLTYLPAREK